MVLIERANPTDRLDVERLIAAYLTSEGVKPHELAQDCGARPVGDPGRCVTCFVSARWEVR